MRPRRPKQYCLQLVIYIYIYIYGRKKHINYKFIPTSLFRGRPLIRGKSPDEWATTKQACRDELVVYVFFSSVYISLYFYVLSTVLRKSSFTLYIYIYIYAVVRQLTKQRCRDAISSLVLTFQPNHSFIYIYTYITRTMENELPFKI